MPIFADNNILYQGDAFAFTRDLAPKVDKFHFGYVYAVKMAPRLIKIGRTADPVERMRSIRRSVAAAPNAMPSRVCLSVGCLNYKEVEASLLEQFSQFQTDGEYFRVAISKVVDAINAERLAVRRTDEEQAAFNRSEHQNETNLRAFLDQTLAPHQGRRDD